MAKSAHSNLEQLQVLTSDFAVLCDKKVVGLRTQSRSPSHGPPSCLTFASPFNQPVVSLLPASKPSSCTNSSGDADIPLQRTGPRPTAPFVPPHSHYFFFTSHLDKIQTSCLCVKGPFPVMNSMIPLFPSFQLSAPTAPSSQCLCKLYNYAQLSHSCSSLCLYPAF